jgi:hypothetical protein
MATRREYFDLDTAAGRIFDRLAETTDGHERARLLVAAYETEQAMADMHTEVFGPDPMEDDGRDLAEALASSALLLTLVADVELVACGQLTRRFTTDTWLEPYAGPVLDRMAATPAVADRARLLEALADAVEPYVGVQAVETLACLPLADGKCGWSDERRLPSTFVGLVRHGWHVWRESRAAS